MGDPIEVLPFVVKADVEANIMIVRTWAQDTVTPMKFKYVVFRGDIDIKEYQNGNSTIIGQANAAGAMSVAQHDTPKHSCIWNSCSNH